MREDVKACVLRGQYHENRLTEKHLVLCNRHIQGDEKGSDFSIQLSPKTQF
jgi:hypothetical protein